MKRGSLKMRKLLGTIIIGGVILTGCSTGEDIQEVNDVESAEQATSSVSISENVDNNDVHNNNVNDNPKDNMVEYAKELEAMVANYLYAVDDIEEWTGKLGSDPSLSLDTEWVYEYRGMFIPILDTIERLNEMKDDKVVPDAFEGAHDSFMEASFYMYASGNLLSESMLEKDNDMFKEGLDMMMDAGEKTMDMLIDLASVDEYDIKIDYSSGK